MSKGRFEKYTRCPPMPHETPQSGGHGMRASAASRARRRSASILRWRRASSAPASAKLTSSSKFTSLDATLELLESGRRPWPYHPPPPPLPPPPPPAVDAVVVPEPVDSESLPASSPSAFARPPRTLRSSSESDASADPASDQLSLLDEAPPAASSPLSGAVGEEEGWCRWR